MTHQGFHAIVILNMPRRHVVFANQEIYHVFNRSVGKEDIFILKHDLSRIFEIINYYRFPQKLRFSKYRTLPVKIKQAYFLNSQKQKPLVEIFSFALMPNHYHLLVRQLKDQGIPHFISNIQNSFARFFNVKNKRIGSLFQNPFKAVHLEDDEDFMHVARYIHLNPVTSFYIKIKELETYPWTSHRFYLDKKANQIVRTDLLLGQFRSRNSYKKFILDQADYQQKLSTIKKLLME